MHKNSNNGPMVETRWHYLGPDNETYGPYNSKDMLFWLQTGYFNETLKLRTENETGYHTLGEWSQVLGTHPFGMPIHSLDATISQMNSIRPPHGPMMIMPPGLQNPFPAPMPMRFPPFMPMPLLHQMGPNGPPMGQMHSQPPSEPIDAGSLSHTPDSEHDTKAIDPSLLQPPQWLIELGLAGHGHGRKTHQHHGHQQHHGVPHSMHPLIPQMHNVQIATEPIVMKNAECQTEPLKVELSKDHASRLLTELLGQMVIIN